MKIKQLLGMLVLDANANEIGKIIDADFDPDEGKISEITVSLKKNMLSSNQLDVKYADIKSIGDYVLLAIEIDKEATIEELEKQKKEAREAERAEREAEREARKAEREAEREAKKAQKEAEREAKRAEREAKKAEKAAEQEAKVEEVKEVKEVVEAEIVEDEKEEATDVKIE